MKKKILTIVLFTCLAMAACGRKENSPILQNDLTENMNKEQETPSVEMTDETEKDNHSEAGNAEENASKDDNSVEDVSEKNTPEESTEETEQEPYILTFEASTIEGEEWNSDKLADSKLTMINVWATYCNPCLAEMPDLGEIAASYDASEFQLIGVVSDVMEGDSTEGVDYAKELIAETGANYPHLLLNESLYVNLVGAVSAVPTTFFVTQKGKVLGYVMGAQEKTTWEALINELLAEVQ